TGVQTCALPIFIHLCCVGRVAERLDHLLGSKRLVRRTRRICMATVGVVGGRASFGGGEIALAISLACTIRVSAHYRRLPLYGFDAGVGAPVVGAALRI